MEKKKKCETKSRQPEQGEPQRIVRGPITPEERARIMANKPKWSCRDCIFCVSHLLLWARTLGSGFPVTGQCANHPDAPGLMRPVLHGQICRNFQAKSRLDRELPVPPNPAIRYIRLTRNLHAIVDAADYEWLKRYKWHAFGSPKKRTFYAARNVAHQVVFMHRAIMNPPQGKVVDHYNGNGLDNRRCNLRICRAAENSRNMAKRAGTRSRFIGVYPHRDKWYVNVTCNGEDHYGGLFDDEVEAAKARDALALRLHGPYARLNFPPEPEAGPGRGE
jgi:hypothetical protein